MGIKELAVEYRENGEKCRRRSSELDELLRCCELTEMQRLTLRRRMAIIDAMARDAIATSNYLRVYYNGKKDAQ